MKAGRYLRIGAAMCGVLSLVLFVSGALIGRSGAYGALATPLALFTMIDKAQEPLPDVLTVMVIGVDARKGSSTMHCDAIHQIHIDRVAGTIEFVNIPRGTYSGIAMPEGWEPRDELLQAVDAQWKLEDAAPEQGTQEESLVAQEEQETVAAEEAAEQRTPEARVRAAWALEQYISNVCAYVSVDEFVRRVDAMTGYHTDYRVLVGFSQAEGILRLLRFNPTATLQFLRHRQSYGLGDVQRSYNQSLFLQDLLTEHFDQVEQLPRAAQAVLFQFVQTDMPWNVAYQLMEWLADSPVRTDAARIFHRTVPASTPRASEIHLDPERADAQVEELLQKLARLKPGFTVQADVQDTLERYTRQHIDAAYAALVDRDLAAAQEALRPLIAQQIWLQLENDEEREALMVRIATLEATVQWYATGSVDAATQTAREMALVLEVEGSDAAVAQIQAFLSILLPEPVILERS